MIPDPESKIPHVAWQLTPCATTTEPVSTTRCHCSEAHTQLREAPAHQAREGPRTATNTQSSQKKYWSLLLRKWSSCFPSAVKIQPKTESHKGEKLFVLGEKERKDVEMSERSHL